MCGAKLHSVAHWDNSPNNPLNPDPSKGVRFGLQTWDEMMVGWVAYVWERPGTAEELAREKVDPADLMFDRFDRNADGVVTPDEIPEQMRLILKGAGVKLPERVTQEQFRTLYAEMRKRFQRPPPQPAEPTKPQPGKD